MKTLLLWDIDGTLIASGGAGMRALRVALQRSFGVEGSLEDIKFGGRTDTWIMREVFRKFGLAATDENFARFFEGYIAALPAELANPQARVLPGVRALLESAGRQPHITQGLLTGNMRRGAEVKLSYHGLWGHFPFGAFADDSEDRNDLGPHALRRARDHAGTDFPPTRTWIIGDTPHDIACARTIGARALVVATGAHASSELASHAPDAILPDLADQQAFWKIVVPAP